ncbi:hypothetical protein LSTR_LSTR003920 [Laodelphax striatellus]|uniref:Uncharacterized protein n=1 Tax=Laodelphax striatellus TaxID=195883 RepID=A0A482X9F9_LAOST|nr:hypothetical protein LSTR_LSTR003920 [Laodelphax striatellus]
MALLRVMLITVFVSCALCNHTAENRHVIDFPDTCCLEELAVSNLNNPIRSLAVEKSPMNCENGECWGKMVNDASAQNRRRELFPVLRDYTSV